MKTIIKCHACSKELNINLPVGRQETCNFCGSDLHCCLNCKFYKFDSYNDCREPQAERVIEKKRSNFCGYFTFGSAPQTDANDSSQMTENARMKLESIFKKD
jgi:hypothetical protein